MNNNPNFIKFLGTGGARFVMANQVRSSAGTYINMKGQRIVLDPGPGTLVKCAKSNPQIPINKLDGIILTHAHIDHSTDVNVLIDGMTKGGFKAKRGTLFAPRDALEGENRVVLRYLRDYLENIVILEPEQEYKLGDLEFSTSIPHDHGDETY
ncbi:MAG: MBL fold metallo-hydrolase, partial [Ardenticatenaceae bacterium]